MKPKNVACFAINKYLLYNKYSFTLQCKYNLIKLKADSNSSYKTEQTFEKSYALNPSNSIRFESIHNVQRFPKEVVCFVEAMFTNMMDHKAFIYDIEIIHNNSLTSMNTPRATWVEFLGLSMKPEEKLPDKQPTEKKTVMGQEIKKKSSYKFLIKYTIDPNTLEAPDYGQIRFWWKGLDPDSEGGALVYTITDQTAREKHHVIVERADDKTLVKNQLNDIELYFINT